MLARIRSSSLRQDDVLPHFRVDRLVLSELLRIDLDVTERRHMMMAWARVEKLWDASLWEGCQCSRLVVHFDLLDVAPFPGESTAARIAF